MRYFIRNDLYKPKDCIWGPRFKEGIILNEEEWLRMNDYGKKKQREKEAEEILERRREKLRERSLEMSSKWENTVMRLKELKVEKEMKEKEKAEAEKLEAYMKMLKKKRRDNEKILKEAYKLVYESKSTTKQILSGAALSAVLFALLVCCRTT